jgi:hypothetical protein
MDNSVQVSVDSGYKGTSVEGVNLTRRHRDGETRGGRGMKTKTADVETR